MQALARASDQFLPPAWIVDEAEEAEAGEEGGGGPWQGRGRPDHALLHVSSNRLGKMAEMRLGDPSQSRTQWMGRLLRRMRQDTMRGPFRPV